MRQMSGCFVYLDRKGQICVYCPFCKCRHVLDRANNIIAEKVIQREDYTRTTETMLENVTCSECGRKYIVDFGRSEYTIYDPARYRNGYERLLAEFHSDWYYDFDVIATRIPESGWWYHVEWQYEHFGFTIHPFFCDSYWKDPQQVLAKAKEKYDAVNYSTDFH
ncbi:MAG: hypothetical protein IKP28_05220 [Clostridia bacterium]|nr:hypothetical protein [Clostridia bacterium]